MEAVGFFARHAIRHSEKSEVPERLSSGLHKARNYGPRNSLTRHMKSFMKAMKAMASMKGQAVPMNVMKSMK